MPQAGMDETREQTFSADLADILLDAENQISFSLDHHEFEDLVAVFDTHRIIVMAVSPFIPEAVAAVFTSKYITETWSSAIEKAILEQTSGSINSYRAVVDLIACFLSCGIVLSAETTKWLVCICLLPWLHLTEVARYFALNS